MEVGLIYKGRETGKTYEERTEAGEVTDDETAKNFLKGSEPVKIMPTMPNSPHFEFADLVGIYFYRE